MVHGHNEAATHLGQCSSDGVRHTPSRRSSSTKALQSPHMLYAAAEWWRAFSTDPCAMTWCPQASTRMGDSDPACTPYSTQKACKRLFACCLHPDNPDKASIDQTVSQHRYLSGIYVTIHTRPRVNLSLLPTVQQSSGPAARADEYTRSLT